MLKKKKSKPVKYNSHDRAKINEKLKEQFVKRVKKLKLKVYVDRLEI